MDRQGGDHTAPRERGWFSAHPAASADRRAYTPAGTEPCSRDHISGNRHTTADSMKWRSGNRYAATDSTNWRSGYRHSANNSPRGRFWRGKERDSGGRKTPGQGNTEWRKVQPVACEKHEKSVLQRGASLQSEKSDFSSNCSRGTSESGVPEKCSGVAGDEMPLALDLSLIEKSKAANQTSSAPTKHAGHSRHSDCKGSEDAIEQDCSKSLESETDATAPFDICPPKSGFGFKLKESLFETNKARRRSQVQKRIVIRDGMVLLKNYVSLSEQVKIVKECQRLGLGSGGFYQPGYRDGAKLNLRMMCLGKNWDPETSSYGDVRPMDGARPPPIPTEFSELVERSIKESHKLIAEECQNLRAEAVLPPMSPDICIVNFYTTSGRLGLHQDRDESKDSLRMGLPVVSVSIGDSAEFLYGDQRDVDKAEKVTLESGDVLIFGGKSRHVFHGVSSVKSDTAPKALLGETDIRPGRLNLTFRKY